MSKAHRELRAAQTKLVIGSEKTRHLGAQIKTAYSKLDDAIAQTLRMSADLVEAAQFIDLEPETGQKLFDELSGCTEAMFNSRQRLLTAHRRATGIRMRTDQAVAYEGTWAVPEHDNVVPLNVVAA